MHIPYVQDKHFYVVCVSNGLTANILHERCGESMSEFFNETMKLPQMMQV